MTRKRPLALARVRLRDVRSIKSADIHFLSNGKPRKMTVFIGENGSGKSSILRAIAIGLCPQRQASGLISKLSGSFIRKNKKGNVAAQAVISLDLADPDYPDRRYEIKTIIETDESGQEFLTKELTPDPFPWDRVFVCGYGVNRGSTRYSPLEEYKIEDAVRTLFSEDSGLLDPENVLRVFKLAQYENGSKTRVFKEAIAHLKKVFRLNSNHAIQVNSDGVLVHGPWAPMPFHALGDGYRGTAGWLLDLLGRTFKANQGLGEQGLEGIVFIDELDEHLHPSWQKQIVLELKRRLPGIQFICTTHSPLTILNCQHDEVLVCRLSNAVGQVVSNLPGVSGRTADEILKGEWFGLSSTIDRRSEKLLEKYHKAVKQRASEQDIGKLRSRLRDRLGISWRHLSMNR